MGFTWSAPLDVRSRPAVRDQTDPGRTRIDDVSAASARHPAKAWTARCVTSRGWLIGVPETFDALLPYVGRALGMSERDLQASFRPATVADLQSVLTLRRAVNAEMWWDDEAFVGWRYFGRRDHEGIVPYWIFARDGAVLGACGLE